MVRFAALRVKPTYALVVTQTLTADMTAKDRNPGTRRKPWCCRSENVHRLCKTKLPTVDTIVATAEGSQPRCEENVKRRAMVPRLTRIPAQPTTPYLMTQALSRI